jgi:hypothetical protein
MIGPHTVYCAACLTTSPGVLVTELIKLPLHCRVACQRHHRHIATDRAREPDPVLTHRVDPKRRGDVTTHRIQTLKPTVNTWESRKLLLAW